MYLEYSGLNEIRVNDSTVVLTQKNGLGWKLDAGDCIRFDYSNYVKEIDCSTIEIYLLRNDIIHTGYIMPANIQQCEIEITESGTYCLCLCVQEEQW